MNNLESDKKINIGVIGCGSIVSTVHLPVLLNIDNLEISFLFDINKEKSKKLANKFGLSYVKRKEDIMWERPDAFLIAVPYGVRDDIYKKISSNAKSDASIFVEKPVVLSQKDVEKFKDRNIFSRTFSGFMRRHQSNTNILKEIINKDGFINDIEEINISEGAKTTSTNFESSNYRTSAELSGGGVLAETSCHMIDQICYMFSDFEFKVSDASIVYDGNIDVHVDATIQINKGNKILPVNAVFSRLKNIPSKIDIIGRNISLSTGVKPGDKVSFRFNSSNDNFYKVDHKLGFSTKSYQSFYLEWISVLSDILNKKNSVNRLENTYNSGLLIESIYNFANKEEKIRYI